LSNPKDAVWYLRVDEERTGSVVVLTLSGRVSHQTSPQLGTALSEALDSLGGVVVDLSGVDYISSAGLKAIQHASKRMAERDRVFVVCGLREVLNVAFTLAGLAATLAIEPSRELAVARAGRLDTSQRDV
jgi:anti-anti-sigma factor